MAEKQRLKISRWNIANSAVDGAYSPFEAMLNPSSYAISRSVQLTRDIKTNGKQCESLTIGELVLDGTGVVPPPAGMPFSVQSQVSMLLSLMTAQTDKGKVVRPVVEVVWGTLYYIGRVDNVKTDYTLFAPDGTPLRARLSLTLAEFNVAADKKQTAKDAAMARQLALEAAVRLPELCFQAYNSTSMVQEVARYNDLTSFRNVPAGTRITCPARG
jgi:hypothetical protein